MRTIFIFSMVLIVNPISAQQVSIERNSPGLINKSVLSPPSFSIDTPIVYIDEAAYMAAIDSNYYLENFDIYGFREPLNDDTLLFDSNTFSYYITAYPHGGMWAQYYAISVNYRFDTLIIDNTGSHINCFGGYFFTTDVMGNDMNDSIILMFGDYKYTYYAEGRSTFIGFIFPDSIPYILMRTGNYWGGIDNLYMGHTNCKPVLLSIIDTTIIENTTLTLTMADVTVTDPDGTDNLFLVVEGNDNYTFTNTTITPDLNFVGTLQVPVKVSDGIDSSNTDMINVVVTPSPNSGITYEINGNDPNLYPNPFNDYFIIEANSGIKSSYTLLSVSGTIISQGEIIGNKTIVASELQKGLYILKVNSNNKTKNFKIIKD
jgi:hypothetical protein